MLKYLSLSRKVGGLRVWWPDLCMLSCLFLFNPIVWFFNWSVWSYYPDTIAYIEMGREIIENGRLYLSGWGHAKTGVVLPPLYPFLIACGQLFSSNELTIAEWGSRILAISATIPMYFYIKRMAGRWLAAVSLISIQISGSYFLMGMRPLTEALFLAGLSLLLLLTVRLIHSAGSQVRILSLATGAGCAILFFSRQVGIFYICFLTVFFSLQWVAAPTPRARSEVFFKLLWSIVGFSIPFLIYATVLYHQTGTHPLDQHFRTTSNQTAKISPEVEKEIQKIKSIEETNYVITYFKRRLMRKLLPDASEMYSHLNTENKSSKGIFSPIVSALVHPGRYFGNLVGNLNNLKMSVGWIPLVLFLIASATPLCFKAANIQLSARLLIPGCCLCYLLFVSLATDKIVRYAHVLTPFVISQIAIEAAFVWKRMAKRYNFTISSAIPFCLLGMILFAGTPAFFTSIEAMPKKQSSATVFHEIQNFTDGESVFALSPFDAYFSGGRYRVLPNDSLEKIVRYGHKTGVRWILVDTSMRAAGELRFYSHAKWYTKESLEKNYPDLVRFKAASLDNTLRLYEIL